MTNNQRDTCGSPIVTILVVLLHLVTGGVFAFSGLAKAIDPWGGYYKITEYLNALGWVQWTDFALLAAVALAAAEAVLGVLLMVGAYRRGAPALLLLLMLVLTPLTLWLAITDAVADCGCFGDALHLSNWATFGKNLLLLAALAVLLWLRPRIRGWYGPAVQWIVAALTLAVVLAVAYVGYFTQPLIDFRPYKVGTRLAAFNPAPSDDDYLFIYKKDGKEQAFSLDSLPDEEDGWTFVDRRPVSATRGNVVEKSGHQLVMLDDGIDVTADVLGDSCVMLILFPDLPTVSVAHTFAIHGLADYAQAHHAAFYGVSAATEPEVEHWRDISMASYPMLTADDSDIKMLARGNPAVACVEGGVVKWKRTLGSISADRIHDPVLTPASLGDDLQPAFTLSKIFTPYVLAMITLLVINRTHLLVGALIRRVRRNGGEREEQPAEPANEQNNEE